MDGADTGAGLHRDDAFDAHRQVDDDAIALLDATRLERIGELADLGQQLLIGDLGDGTVVRFEDDGNLVAEAGFDVAVEAVVRDVQLAIGKPLEERRVRLVEHLGERLLPADMLTGQAGPVTGVVFFGLIAQRLVGIHAGDRRLLDEIGRGVEKLYGFILGHVPSPEQCCCYGYLEWVQRKNAIRRCQSYIPLTLKVLLQRGFAALQHRKNAKIAAL